MTPFYQQVDKKKLSSIKYELHILGNVWVAVRMPESWAVQ